MSEVNASGAQKPLVIDCRQVTRTYSEGPEKLTIFSDISLEVTPGETVAIVGSSGAGKTTLLNLLGGLDRPSSGKIEICGQNIHQLSEAGRARFRNRHLGFVYQFHHLLPEFTALENVMMPCALGGHTLAKARQKAEALLERVGLAERMRHKPGELSGGERQRVAIARALVNNPSVIFADEPTGSLDEQNASLVEDLLFSLVQQQQVALMLITHNYSFAQRCDVVYHLHDRKVEVSS